MTLIAEAPEIRTVTPRSLFQFAWEEAQRYKYIESEKAGEDLGDEAIDAWHREHWLVWVRHRWMEHIDGKIWWEEFDPEKFDSATALHEEYTEVFEPVADQARQGAENLHICAWARDNLIDIDTLVEILTVIDLNWHRCSYACRRIAPDTP